MKHNKTYDFRIRTRFPRLIVVLVVLSLCPALATSSFAQSAGVAKSNRNGVVAKSNKNYETPPSPYQAGNASTRPSVSYSSVEPRQAANDEKSRPLASREQKTIGSANKKLSAVLDSLDEKPSQETAPRSPSTWDSSLVSDVLNDGSDDLDSTAKETTNARPKRSRKSLRSQPVAQLLTLDESDLTPEPIAASPSANVPTLADSAPQSNAQVPNAAPVAQIPNAAPVAQIPNAAPVAQIPNAAPVAQVPNAAPLAQVPNAAPLAQIPNAVPLAQVPNAAPLAQVPNAAPVAQIPNAAPVWNQIPSATPQNAASSPTSERFAELKPIESNVEGTNPNRLVVKQQSPVIDVQTIGLQKLIVGQESAYVLKVRNQSAIEAQNLTLETQIPNWVNVSDLKPSAGTTQILPSETPESPACCQWKIGTLNAGREETLTLKLIPQQRNNFELVSRYEFDQTTLKAGVEVQEPILELSIDGRESIEWGTEDKYRLRIRNVGNGDAENVRLLVSTGENEQATQVLDVLKAGDEKTMEMAIKTVLENQITLSVEANGEYGLTAGVQKTIAILRGQLDVFVEAPELQFVNNSLDYLVHVANIGTAPLKNVAVVANLPPEVEFVSCSGDGRANEAKNRVAWSIPQMNPNDQLVFQVACSITRPGASRMDVSVSEPFGLVANGEAIVQVEAIATLNMRINAPQEPVAVGTPIVYEVVVANNGTKAAANINAGLFFAEGLRPLSIEGNVGNVFPNESKVMFNSIDSLPPGESITFKIQAEAVAAGNQKVQAILDSREDDIQLVCEEMVYCYEKRTIANRSRRSPSQVALQPTEERRTSQDVRLVPANQPIPVPTSSAPGSVVPQSSNPNLSRAEFDNSSLSANSRSTVFRNSTVSSKSGVSFDLTETANQKLSNRSNDAPFGTASNAANVFGSSNDRSSTSNVSISEVPTSNAPQSPTDAVPFPEVPTEVVRY